MFSLFRRTPNAHDLSKQIEIICRDYIDKAGLSSTLRVDDIKISADHVAIIALFASTRDDGKTYEVCRSAIQDAVGKVAGINKALVLLTTDQPPLKNTEPPPKPKPKDIGPLLPDGVRVIAVASGKGGVGKSTVAVNLAVALSAMGQKVGLLDADIYGPSIPRLLGVGERKATQADDGRIIPIDVHGIKAMSMGFMVDEKSPMIWRGPMVQSALIQMLRDVIWDGIDTLVIDLPPGTGDIHLTLAQKVPLAGGVVVSTPQDIALIDARKGLEMFRKMDVPILGIVENMSYYSCPQCGHHDHIFGHGGARAEADKIGVPFLGEIPLHTTIRSMSDAGTPVTLFATESDEGKAFMRIASQVANGLALAHNATTAA